jgi:UDP-N-acetylmuramyl pentapeptide synthase
VIGRFFELQPQLSDWSRTSIAQFKINSSPTIALVTRHGSKHGATFESVDNVATADGEIECM